MIPTGIGDKDLSTNIETYTNYIYIDRYRKPPVIENFGKSDTIILCGGGDIDLASTIIQASQTQQIV